MFCQIGLKKSAFDLEYLCNMAITKLQDIKIWFLSFLGTEVEPMLIITENAYEKLIKVTRLKLEEEQSFLVDEEEDENNV